MSLNFIPIHSECSTSAETRGVSAWPLHSSCSLVPQITESRSAAIFNRKSKHASDFPSPQPVKSKTLKRRKILSPRGAPLPPPPLPKPSASPPPVRQQAAISTSPSPLSTRASVTKGVMRRADAAFVARRASRLIQQLPKSSSSKAQTAPLSQNLGLK